MPRLEELVSEQFHEWEKRGRGWQIYPFPVALEPLFSPFRGYRIPLSEDDGRRPTLLSGLVQRLSKALSPERPRPTVPQNEEEIEPVGLERSDVVELQLMLPPDFDVGTQTCAAFLAQLA